MRGMEHGFTDEDDDSGTSPKSRRNFNRIVREVISNAKRFRK